MDFTCKDRWAKDGHRTPDPTAPRYADDESHESIIIAITYAELMKLDVMAADIINAYLQAQNSEKNHFICGTEFVPENVGKVALITRDLYGVKVSDRDFWHHLQTCMEFLGFK